ncbi:MAG: DUF2064 domain-containing protein [Acidobacteria bacterium]|nr:DUF2064 domain-containing protein [Acidobacteriota bacterium]
MGAIRRGRRTAILLFRDIQSSEERRKSLPRGFSRRISRAVERCAASIARTELFTSDLTPDGTRVTSGSTGPLFSAASRSLPDQIAFTIRCARQAGFDRVVLLAGDVPQITRRIIEDARDLVETNQSAAVLGRSPDGGFYLAAFPSATAVRWENLPTFTSEAGDWLRRELELVGQTCRETEPLSDIDSLADALDLFIRHATGPLRALAAELRAALAPVVFLTGQQQIPLQSFLSSVVLRGPPSR